MQDDCGRRPDLEARLVQAVRAMATNANQRYDHELRGRGEEFLHDSGWGAVYREGGRLVRVRSTTPCFLDQRFDDLADVESDLVVVHARRAKNPRTISTANTHPFSRPTSERSGRSATTARSETSRSSRGTRPSSSRARRTRRSSSSTFSRRSAAAAPMRSPASSPASMTSRASTASSSVLCP